MEGKMSLGGRLKSMFNRKGEEKTASRAEDRKPDIGKNELLEEQAAPSLASIRQPIFTDTIADMLSPNKLFAIKQSLKVGESRDYLTLAEELEESDLHYRSVLSTRKSQVTSLECSVKAVDDSPASTEMAEDVTNNIIKATWFKNMETDLLDALGKGYSVCEIIWESSGGKWIPADVKWRDPRFFRYDRETMTRLMLDEGGTEVELVPNKFIIHEPKLKSGLQLKCGLAMPVSYYYLIKTADVSGWAALAQVYGYPLRIGRYGRNASKQDKEVLRKALTNLGRDVGAIVPDAMKIEIINGMTGTGNITLYENLAEWVDKQVSKCVLGQTMSSDAEGGQYKGDLHNEIRLEIKKSDARQLAQTIQRDLIIPYIDFNFGVQEEYPEFLIQLAEPEDIPALCDAVEQLVPLGFKVRSDDLYSKLGLQKPDEKDEILTSAPPMAGENRRNLRTSINSKEDDDGDDNDDLEDLVDDELGDWQEIADPLKKAIEEFAESCSSYEELEKRYGELEKKLEIDPELAKRIALATFKARMLGEKDATGGEDAGGSTRSN